MAFALSGSTITQTGTDTDLSGLSGVGGVTVSGNVYTIPASQSLVVEGTLTLIPEDNVLVFDYDGDTTTVFPRMAVNGTANFTFGKKTVIGDTVTYSRGTGLIFLGSGGSRFRTGDNGAFATLSGNPTISMFGGTIISGKPMSWLGVNGPSYFSNGTMTIEETVVVMTGTGQLRLDSDVSSVFNATNIRLAGQNNNVFLVARSYTSFSAVFDHFVIQSFVGQTQGLLFNNVQFANNQAEADFRFNGGEQVIAFLDSDTGSSTRAIVGGSTDICQVAFFGKLLIRCLDASLNPVTTALYYIKDTDDGNRFAPVGDTSNLSSIIAPYGAASPTVYSETLDASGEASPTILLSTEQNGRTLTPIRSDYSNGGSYSDSMNVFIADYNKVIASQSFVLRTPSGSPANFFLLDDLLISEPSKTAVNAYTNIENSAQFYDRAKAFLIDNYAGQSNTIVDRSGIEIDARGYNVNIDATATNVFAFDGTTITIKASTYTGDMTTTGIITLLNGATFVGTRTDANGTIVPPNTVSITGITPGSRIQIFNVTRATEVVNEIVGGTSYSATYTEGSDYTEGDTIRVRLMYVDGPNAKLEFQGPATAGINGWSLLVEQLDDTVYNTFGIDGSGILQFQADYSAEQVDVVAGANFNLTSFYAWWVYNLSTENGIRDFFGGITALDQANIRINTDVLSLYLDNSTNTNIRQLDNRRFFRSDGEYPVLDPTTGGGGIDVVWRNQILIAQTNVSGLTPQESAELFKLTEVDQRVQAIPVDPVLASDSRLNNLDAPVSGALTTPKFLALK